MVARLSAGWIARRAMAYIEYTSRKTAREESRPWIIGYDGLPG
jgi:hypothetical protein